MTTVDASTVLGILQQHFRGFQRDLPAPLAAELATIDEESTAVAAVFRGPIQHADRAIAAAVAKAVTAGKDPGTDKGVTAALNRRALRDPAVETELRQLWAERRATALDRHADAVIAALADVVADADTAITEARSAIPGLDLTNSDATGLPPAQMGAWGRAREAYDQLHRVVQSWGLLVSAVGRLGWPSPMAPLVLADLSAAELAACPGTDALAAVRAGHRLKLATPEQFLERTARVEAQQRAEAERVADEEYKVYRARVSPVSMG